MAPSTGKLREYFKVEYRPGERLLVQKVDFFILTFCCLSYFMNYVSTRHVTLTVPRHLTDILATIARSLVSTVLLIPVFTRSVMSWNVREHITSSAS